MLFVDNVANDDTPRSGVDVGSQLETFRQGLFPPGPNDGYLVSLPPPRLYSVRAKFGFGKKFDRPLAQSRARFVRLQ